MAPTKELSKVQRDQSGDRLYANGDSPELCGGLRLTPVGTTWRDPGHRSPHSGVASGFSANWQQPGLLLPADEKSLRASPGLKRGGSRLSKLGGLESRPESTSSPDVMTAGRREARPPAYRRGGRPRVLPVCHHGTASSRSLTFTGLRSPRRRLYRWAWIHTPRVCSRSES